MASGSDRHSSDDANFETFKADEIPAPSGIESRGEAAETVRPTDADAPTKRPTPVDAPTKRPTPADATAPGNGSASSGGATWRSPDSDAQGTAGGPILFNKYLLIRELGAGGMGKVFLVRHLKLEAERALKTISPEISKNPEWRHRFSREAKAMARLSHPHIVAVHDADVLPEGDAFIEMEFVRGQSLDKRLQPNVPMPLPWVDLMLGQLCEALQAAHDMGIVHRDLKPQNLMLQDGPSPGQETLKILDFGIAKILNSSDPGDELTRLGQSLGTPHYMSPEQIGRDNQAVKVTSDIYSVGVILYRLLTGCLPYMGAQHMVFIGHLYHPPPPFAEKNPEAKIPAEVEALVMRCLEKDPQQRPQSARALAEEFHRLVAPLPDSSASNPDRRVLGRRSWLALAGMMTAGVLVVRQLWHRDPSTGQFAVTPKPERLSLAAGGETLLVLRFSGNRARSPVDVSFLSPPWYIGNEENGHFDDQVVFNIKADLNATYGPTALNLRVEAGRNSRNLTIPVTIDPPSIAPLPNGFQGAEGSSLRRLANGKIYPERIVRRLSDRLSVVFVLIASEPGNSGPTLPFYIMENKVWNELFDAFLKDPQAAQGLTPGLARRSTSPPDQNGSWPAFGVKVQEAQQFARWLVSAPPSNLRGDLPTTDQWDKASGFFDKETRDTKFDDRGPFLRGESEDQQAGIAIRREGPLPVGTATRDISRFGCRDMAGNGMEWTRPREDRKGYVELRGQKFRLQRPFEFKDREKDVERADKAQSWIGFRLVLEGI